MMRYLVAYGLHIHVDKDRAKAGDPCITVSQADTGEVVKRGRTVLVYGHWKIEQRPSPAPCGASVVLSPVGSATYAIQED